MGALWRSHINTIRSSHDNRLFQASCQRPRAHAHRPKKITMPTADGRTFSDVSLGFVTFTVEGRTVHLEPIQQTDGTLGFLFRDQTSGSTTYGAGIELIAPAPSNGIHASGTVTLDFNNAHNPPCAYTGYATCPIRPKDNQLNVSIPAEEKRYHP